MSGSIRRQKSGRDPRKAENQRLNLGSQVTAREPQSYNLVVCGATYYKEGFIFSDFMGFCMALREHGVGGDFLSCFPLEEHFMWLQNENSPPITTIKFGKLGPNNDKALYTYSRHQFVNRQYWWTQVAHHQLLEKVQNWISDKKQQAVTGDVVNIILEGHGTRKGEYCIGSSHIHPYVFRDLLSGFKDGVQVNAVSGACYSGRFIDAVRSSNQKNRYLSVACPGNEKAPATTRSLSNRIRNSRFSHAFVQSLARVNLPGVARRRITWKIQDHETFIREQLTRNLTPGGLIVPPQFYASEPINGMTLVEDLIFRDKADIVYDPRISSRRRRPEWPTIDSNIQSNLSANDDGLSSPTIVKESTRIVIDNEISKCDTRSDLRSDINVYNECFVKHPNWRLVMRNLYWRARRQSAIWDVFELLVMRGFLDPKCLTTPVDLLSMSPDTSLVSDLLHCFSYPSRDMYLACGNNIPLQSTAWDADIDWLATMIVRSGANLPELFETIHTSKFLGECQRDEYQMFMKMNPDAEISQSPRERECYSNDGNQTFGFWLPHGLTPDDKIFAEQIRACQERFNQIERGFRESENLPVDKLWLEVEQVDFFEQNPELLPGAGHDHPEVEIKVDFDDSSTLPEDLKK